MKNKKILNKKISTEIGVGVVLLVAILIGGAFYLQSKKEQPVVNAPEIKQPQVQNQKLTQQNQDQEVSSNLGEVGENSSIVVNSWKAYTDKKYGYSIEYPSNWNSDFVDGSSFYVKELLKTGETHPSFGNVTNNLNATGDYFINISVYPEIGSHVSLKDWRKNDGSNYKDVVIKGHPALKFEDKPYFNNGKMMAGSLRYYLIDNKNNGFEITIWYKDSSNGIGDRIISTLSL